MRLLVIKHGALGDIAQAFRAFAGIRAAYPEGEITLLTTAPFRDFLSLTPWFDHIEIDDRLPFWNLAALSRLRRQLRGYDLVIDLQTSARSTRYYRLAGRPAWSGIARNCSFAHADPARTSLHTRERLAAQLAIAGIGMPGVPDLDWARRADLTRFALPPAYAVLVPGASRHRPEKRWPPAHYAALARSLPHPALVLGGAADRLREVEARDLTGQTDLAELTAIIAGAKLAIGNDTGPMHLAAQFGVPSLVLFSAASDPALTAPRYPDGGFPIVLRADRLADLPVATVLASLP